MIPSLINNYNVYNGANKLVGVSGETELPDFSSMTETLEGVGIGGEIDDVVTGQFESMSITIPFSNLYRSMAEIANVNDSVLLTLRGSEQVLDNATGATRFTPVRIVIRGKAKDINPGSFQKGKKMEGSVELEILYIKIEFDGEPQIELDKLNFIYKVLGRDLLAQVRAQC